MKKTLRKIRLIFDVENWLWKSEIGIFGLLDLERELIYQKNFLCKSAIFRYWQLMPFDAEVAEKFLNVIYYISNLLQVEAQQVFFSRAVISVRNKATLSMM